MLTISEFKKSTGVSVTLNHTAKMSGLSSLSTSPLCNPYCQKRVNNPHMICSHCYSCNMQKMYKGLRENLIRNSEVLTTRILSDSEIPRLYSETGFFRFESFGDIVNEIQVVNYFKIARMNKHMKCALWTKNPWVIKSAMDTYGIKKPRNLKIIGSSYFTNKPMIKFYQQYDFIDNVFTVYDKNFILANDVEITCGARSCAKCGKCYTGKHKSYEISEKLK